MFQTWFDQIGNYLKEAQLTDITPDRIFNSDETISLNPVTEKVLAKKDAKNVTQVTGNNEKENVTVLVTGNAAGQLAPTFILFKGKGLPDNVAEYAPEEFSFGCSENGWMQSNTFYEYIANIFNPWLEEKKIKKPVIMYLDGHVSHLTLD